MVCGYPRSREMSSRRSWRMPISKLNITSIKFTKRRNWSLRKPLSSSIIFDSVGFGSWRGS